MYTPSYDPAGKFIGVTDMYGSQIPCSPDNADWQRFLLWQNDLENKYPIDLRNQDQHVPTLPELTLADLTKKERDKLLDIALAGYLKTHPQVIEEIRKK